MFREVEGGKRQPIGGNGGLEGARKGLEGDCEQSAGGDRLCAGGCEQERGTGQGETVACGEEERVFAHGFEVPETGKRETEGEVAGMGRERVGVRPRQTRMGPGPFRLRVPRIRPVLRCESPESDPSGQRQ